MTLEERHTIAEELNIPEFINLYTRSGAVETVLILEEAKQTADNVLATYRVNASFNYSLHGETGNYTAIDFSGGPFLSLKANVGPGKPGGRSIMRIVAILGQKLVLEKAVEVKNPLKTNNMTNAEKRKSLRTSGWDIEITVIADIQTTSRHTGKYRYLISHWGADHILIKNYYNDYQFDSYEDAENAALAFIDGILAAKEK